MLKVYIAGPLTKRGKTDASPAGRELNVTEAMAVAAELVAKGFNVYVPHASHYIDILASEPIPYETWMAIDFEWLEKCDVLYRMPGHSPGADREVECAKQHDIPVVFLLADLQGERERQEAYAEFCQLMPRHKGNKDLFESWRLDMRGRVQKVVAGETPRVDPERLALTQAGLSASRADDPKNELARPGITPAAFDRPARGPDQRESRADWQARVAGSAQVLLDTQRAEAQAEVAATRARSARLEEASEALAALKRRKLGEADDGVADKVRSVLAALRPSADEELFIEVRHKDGSRCRRVLW